MTAELRCNAVVAPDRCTATFLIPDLYTVSEARKEAATQGWRTRKPSATRMPVIDRCPEHAKTRNGL